MALTPSVMIQLGLKAPDFDLNDVVEGRRFSLASFSGKKVMLVMFICCHCPYVKHIQNELAKIGKDYEKKDLAIVAISSNDAHNYPEDSPDNLKRMALSLDFRFPYLHDETQEVAKAYQAACTPDFFLYDGNRKLVYRGQLDDSRPGNGKAVTGKDLRAAIEAVLSGQKVSDHQRASVGCNIKWR